MFSNLMGLINVKIVVNRLTCSCLDPRFLRKCFFIPFFFFLVSSVSVAHENFAHAKNFRLPFIDGASELSLADYDGYVIYINFWSSWCGPCRASFPLLQELRDRYYAQGFEIISINLDQNPKDALKFLDQNPVSFPVLQDEKKRVSRLYKLKSIPSSYLIDASGHIVLNLQGFNRTDIDTIESMIIRAFES